MDSISRCPNTLQMSNLDVGTSLRWLSSSTMTKWHHFDSTSDPEPQNLSQVGWVQLCKAATLWQWTAYLCAQTYHIWLMWMQEAIWGGCQLQPWHNGIILTPQVTQRPKVWAKYCGYNCVRLILYAHGQHINGLKHFVNVLYGCWKQFEVAVRHNHDIMTSFWLLMWARTPKSEPRVVDITLIGCYSLTMDSISMCSNTSYMSNMDGGSSLRWLSASTMTWWHHFDSISDPEPQNLSQVGWV